MTTLINVPMPTTARYATSKYDFRSLEVNGPAMVELDVVQPNRVTSRLQSALVAARKRHPELKNRVFKIRAFDHEGSVAVGCWRIA